MSDRVYLSPPHLTGREESAVREAIASGWVAPVGPELERFERALAERLGVEHAVAVSSGTAALHLALRLLEIGPGDDVLCSTFTFCASANPIVYEGARPVFVDSDEATWNMDPTLLAEELERRAQADALPRAVVLVHLYGQSADFEPIRAACARYDVPIVEDAAEALGASYRGAAVGALGELGVFSFNGNKIITSSGGGMLVSNDEDAIERARFLATQARDDAPHYQHSVVGYNYRMSNLLAAIGRAQLETLDERISARRANFEAYRTALGELPGARFMPEADYGTSTRWLTCLTIDPVRFGANREDVRLALEGENIEARPLWKPLHLQPVFASSPSVGGQVSQKLFEDGLCLPSGSNLSPADRDRVIDTVRRQCPHA